MLGAARSHDNAHGVPAMTDIERPSLLSIRRCVDEQSFARARNYVNDECWSNLCVRGSVISGLCQGTASAPYRVEATFDAGEVSRADCSCPVGGGGHCKHVAALLMYYRAHPDAFIEAEEPSAVLDRLSKRELIDLVKRMIRRAPDLELLLDGHGSGDAASADAEAYRRQARAAYAHRDGEWGSGHEIARELSGIVADGDEFRSQGNTAAAAAAYRGVADVALERLETIDDENGDTLAVVGECAHGLCECLAATAPENADERRELLRALWELYAEDEAHGGLGAGDRIDEAFIRNATPAEQAMLAGWVRERIPTGDGWSGQYSRRVFGDLLLRLEGDTLDDDGYLRVCRETGRTEELIDRLLRLGRQREAIAELKKAADHDLLRLADLFVEHTHGDAAEAVVRNRTPRDWAAEPFLAWRKRRAQTRGDDATERELADALFAARPTLAHYDELRRLIAPSDWPARRKKLLADLDRMQSSTLLIDIYLKEGEVEKALAVLRKPWGKRSARTLDVARAAEKEHPHQATTIYRQAAEALVEQRGRTSYRDAAALLKKVRDLQRRLGDEAGWAKYIAGLRDRHKALRALREELDAAGI